MTTGHDASCCICGEAAKYRCPACLKQTCCLKCVAAHKERYECSGRPQPSYVPIQEMTDQTLSNDVSLLDRISRVIESTSRAFVQRQIDAHVKASKRIKTAALRKCCDDRGIILQLCPSHLSRHLRNYTCLRKGNMYWTVEWYFAKPDILLFERRVSEKCTIAKALERVLMRVAGKRNTANLLREYLDIHNVVILIRDIGEINNKSRYFMCDTHFTLRESIEKTRILEFPRIDVVLKRDLHLYKIVERRSQTSPEDGKIVEEPHE
ncbi:hypothetical protein, conserved [Babesia bigemina]|uniref:HIT-type domain-containing protein n=1 Tax=Babesia bigemina TaxID=5866 RepID=A0A061DDP3_BABBI|nr:hypothetical protein, conserved [Babesia bigemina]CDR97584.1 hypothetical protein, conserved [Babesia bigemina]|eukprot:XP_012769770.1 hypothetical protein, conserved [Babesia bigemina]